MSEEKLYAVKNDEGKYFDCEYAEFLSLSDAHGPTIVSEDNAKDIARDYGGHVVALVEEPEKVVVSPEEAKLVKNCLWTNLQDAFLNNINLLFRGRRPEDVTRLKSALTNGYTVAKEKKYRVLSPKSWWYDDDSPLYLLRDFTDGMRLTVKRDNPSTVFTKEQLNAFELNGAPFTKEEVTDDEQ
ncbi:hypothetical protein [Lacticaseibacillus paracasei]|uniref:hypothetical protein n=1 Tax=Lacticaseibacillus paracasei TaxID=1597 RepID=UPI002F265EB8